MERLEKLVNKHHEENIPLITIEVDDNENPRITRARKCVTSWDTKTTVMAVSFMVILFGGIKLFC